MTDDAPGLDDDPFLLAGAYALGVLEGEDLLTAQRAHLSDQAFREATDWWQWRLGTMAEAAPGFMPSPETLAAIERRIDMIEKTYAGEKMGGAVTDLPPSRAAGPAGWSIAAALAGAGMAAAAIALYVSTPAPTPSPSEPTVAPASAPQLVAQLQDEAGERKLVSRFDPQSRRLALSIEGLAADEGQAPELWVIPVGGDPVSLGSIPETGEFSRVLDKGEAALLRSGATVAVTFEEDTGVRHAVPSPPILLAGALDQV